MSLQRCCYPFQWNKKVADFGAPSVRKVPQIDFYKQHVRCILYAMLAVLYWNIFILRYCVDFSDSKNKNDRFEKYLQLTEMLLFSLNCSSFDPLQLSCSCHRKRCGMIFLLQIHSKVHFFGKIGGCPQRRIATLNTHPKNQWVHIKKHTCVWFGMCPIAVRFIWQGHGNMIQYPRSVLPSAVLYGMTTILRASVAMKCPQRIFHRKQCRFKRKHSAWKYQLQSLCCCEWKQSNSAFDDIFFLRFYEPTERLSEQNHGRKAEQPVVFRAGTAAERRASSAKKRCEYRATGHGFNAGTSNACVGIRTWIQYDAGCTDAKQQWWFWCENNSNSHCRTDHITSSSESYRSGWKDNNGGCSKISRRWK